MSLLKKLYEGIHEMAENASPVGTGMGGILLMDSILTHTLKPFRDEDIAEGKKQGYELASKEYERKLLEQGKKFLEQKTVLQGQWDEYEKLLDEYEAEITNLTEKNELTEKENEYLKELLIRERRLKNIKK